QAHRSLDLHPAVAHCFRFWLWLTTGMQTGEWVAVHRKHHARCETPDDPHSPQIFGLAKVLLEGAELYRSEAANAATLAAYGHGTPDDAIERHLYRRHHRLGIGLMLALDVVAFGPLGLAVWAVQMAWIPVFAAGVINGVGHYSGYRNFAPNDASRNIVPLGILIGGEELHNNHHAHIGSAKLSSRWWEVDIGWCYIRILALLRLATVRRIAPTVRLRRNVVVCDATTVQAVRRHRYRVLAQFGKYLRRAVAVELRSPDLAAQMPARAAARVRRAARWWLQGLTDRIAPLDRGILERMLVASTALGKIDALRQELASIWEQSSALTDQLAAQLEDWCQRAERSRIKGLAEFSRQLRCYS
ncbi:MAG: fatty acid desaturase, partial [Rhodocyclales bacterium]|nr:fatty acid desaturase [Rhodocyclales bacterium]